MASEAVEVIVEEVANNLEEVADATRRINTSGVGYFLGGILIGGGLGFYLGYKLNKAKIKAEALAEAEKEIEEVREIYRQKAVALENEHKPEPGELVEDLGYSVRDDMGMVAERPLRPSVPLTDIVEPQHVAYHMPRPTADRPTPTPEPITEMEVGENGEVRVKKDKNIGWDQARENDGRSSNKPYVIHQDEFEAGDFEYSKVVYTYFDADDVMVDTADGDPIPNAAEIVGEANLKWGHGSDDEDVVFVRNDRFELDIQIFRSPKSYEEEVLGLENDSSTTT